MKISLVSIVAFGAAITGIAASPVAKAEVEKRAPEDAVAVLNSLFTTVQGFTGKINATAASINAGSSAADKAAAGTVISDALGDIASAIDGATASINGIAGTKKLKLRSLVTRQADGNAIAAALAVLLEELGGTLNSVIATLGLQTLLGFLSPLQLSLAGLVSALQLLVDNLLVLVKQLVDGLLSGLTLTLLGLQL